MNDRPSPKRKRSDDDDIDEPPKEDAAELDDNERKQSPRPSINLEALHEQAGHVPLTLEEVFARLCIVYTVFPRVPVFDFVDERAWRVDLAGPLSGWANEFRASLDEYELLLACVGPLTYNGLEVKISAETKSNLANLHGELALSQLQIATLVKPKLFDVIAPATVLVVDSVAKVQLDGCLTERSTYREVPIHSDEVAYATRFLAVNAGTLRQVTLTNMFRTIVAVDCFLKVADNGLQGNYKDTSIAVSM
jgi:hypothetical protein